MKLKLELPEIETYRRDIEREFVGRKIKAVDPKVMTLFPEIKTKKEVTELIVGSKIESVDRKGMTITVELNNGNYLVIRIGEAAEMSKGSKDRKPKLKMTFSFTQGGDWKIWDSSAQTKILITDAEGLPHALYDEERPGLDLQSQPLSWIEFGRFVIQQDKPLKQLLTDQSIFVGIGDIYSNEILFDAGLMYDRSSSTLSTQEVRRLYRSVAGVLHEAARYGGTSHPDRPFFNMIGEEGLFSQHLAVFDKAGELSPRSRTEILKTRFKNQPVFYCSTQV